MANFELLKEIVSPNNSKIVLLVMDGLGGLPREVNGPTKLEHAIPDAGCHRNRKSSPESGGASGTRAGRGSNCAGGESGFARGRQHCAFADDWD